MRIAFIGPVPPHRGGIAQHSWNLVEALEGLGHSVHVVTWRRQYPAVLYKGYRPSESELARVRALAKIDWYSPRSWRKAVRLLADHEPELLVVPWVTPFQAPVYQYFSHRLNAHLALVLHNPEMHEGPRFGGGLLMRAVSRASVVITHSKYNQERLNLGAAQIKVVPHPPNLSLRPSHLPAGPPFALLFIGFVRRYKGVMELIDATRLLLQRGVDVHTVIAGEFWDSVDEYRERVRALDLADSVEIHAGYVTPLRMQELLDAAHIVVLPYRSASQSGVVPLAYAAGRPVVATSVGGLPEQVAAGSTGELAAPNDPISLAGAVERVLGQLDVLAQGARDASSTWAEVAEALLEPISEN